MSQLGPLLTKFKASGADRLIIASGEDVVAIRGDQRRTVAGPFKANVIREALAEVLSADELDSLPTNRARTVRHNHEGDQFVFEIIRQPAGIAFSVRMAQGRPAAAPREPDPMSIKEPARSSRRPRGSKRPPAGVTNVELDLLKTPQRAPRISLTEIEMPIIDGHKGRPQVPAMLENGPSRIDDLLRHMTKEKASDLHMSAGSAPVLRVDGHIRFEKDRAVLSGDEIFALVSEIMTDKARADFEANSDADFAYEIAGVARYRVNVFKDRNGVGAVMRRIPVDIIPADKLGLPKACLDLCWLTKGLVVVTGPTGSGKSTTLAAMIDLINKNRTDHVITIEDPVEFVHQNVKCLVNQREVGAHTKSFKNALRAALREDPDIVLVGEMRDLETISIAIETAETGHLVFGTLHTTTAVSTVDRIIDQFPSDRQAQVRVMLSESLKGVIAQVLLPKIGGGRVAAYEILLGNHAVSSMIREGKTFQLASVMQTQKAQGMTTLNDSLMTLVQNRLVEPKNAYLKAVDKSGLLALFKSAGLPTQFA